MTSTAADAGPELASTGGTRAPLVHPVHLGTSVGAWFTGRAAGNLSHRRPHLPSSLARRRAAVRRDLDVDRLHLMRQVHGADVGIVTADTPEAAEIRGVDALVTDVPGRPLAVQVADCVPILLAARSGPVAAVHAGRRGLVAGILDVALGVLDDLGAVSLRAAIGPAIGGCCYEVPEPMRDAVARMQPAAHAVTTWGTASIDLPAAVGAILTEAGVDIVDTSFGCTRCDRDQRWFSHRADPGAGRQLGIVVRRDGTDA